MVNYLKAAARDDHVEAMWRLGCVYNGDCDLGLIKKDEKTAVEMYRNAADGGSASAQFVLGVAYELGDLGLEKDEKTALEMYRNAADGGDEEAQYELSDAYHIGKFGLDVDQEKAFGFLQEAAKGGSSGAQDKIKRIETIGTYCDRCMCPEFLCAGHGSDFCEEFTRVPQFHHNCSWCIDLIAAAPACS